MQQFKIEHFEREHPGRQFPSYVTLSREEARRIRRSFAKQANLGGPADAATLLTHLLGTAHAVDNANAESEGFDLLSVMNGLGLEPRPYVYINWDVFITIDRMALSDLTSYFDDIWYPSSDDIEIFDDTLSWVLFVQHYGTLACMRFARTEVGAGFAEDVIPRR